MTELIIVVALVLVGGVFAGAEIAVVTLRKTRIEELADEGSSRARTLLALREEPERFLATVQIGITVVGATAAAFGGSSIGERLAPHFERWLGWSPEHAEELALGLVVVFVSYLSIVVGELVPKSLAMRAAERYALLISKPMYALSWLARPIVWLLSFSANLLLRPFGDSTNFTETRHSPEEVQQIVEEGVKAGTIHPEAGEIVSRALDLPELRVRDVMVPRQEVVLLSKNATPDELRKLIEGNAHSRMPVYEGREDNVVGYVSLKDVLVQALQGTPVRVPALLRPPYFVPDSKRAVDLLRDMKGQRQPLAIVVDEQGGIAGIVTLEDLLEELVGDIVNEHARHVPQLIERESDGSAIVNGVTPIREVNRALGIELPEDAAWTTVAGLSLALAGRMPTQGEVLTVTGGTALEMLDVSPRRVRAVRVRPARHGQSA